MVQLANAAWVLVLACCHMGLRCAEGILIQPGQGAIAILPPAAIAR